MGKRENLLRAQANQAHIANIESGQRQQAISSLVGSAFAPEHSLPGFYSMPSNQALSQAQGCERALAGEVRNLFRDELDPDNVTDRWREQFAEPAMQAWLDYNAPQIRDEFAGVAGGFYSSDRGRRVSSEANRFMGSYVTPQLFASTEAAAARRQVL